MLWTKYQLDLRPAIIKAQLLSPPNLFVTRCNCPTGKKFTLKFKFRYFADLASLLYLIPSCSQNLTHTSLSISCLKFIDGSLLMFNSMNLAVLSLVAKLNPVCKPTLCSVCFAPSLCNHEAHETLIVESRRFCTRRAPTSWTSNCRSYIIRKETCTTAYCQT